MTPRLAAAIVMYAAILFVLPGCVTNTAKFTQTECYPDGTPKTVIVAKSRTYATAGSRLAIGKGKVQGYIDGKRVTVGQDASGMEAGGEPAEVIDKATPGILKLMELWAK